MSVKSDMMEIIDQATTQKTSAYDSTAEVTRVEGDTIWVHLAGGVTETPVRKTINARPGDTVQVRVSGGRAWIQGNETNPPTDDTAANKAAADAVRANAAAQSAVQSATKASVAAEQASAAASRAEAKADTASAAATRAETAAGNAESAAASAQTSADGALVGLSTVQDVVGVLNWITAHGTMTSQSGGTFDDNQVYFIQDNNGDYTVGGVRYSLVAEPKAADINSYYVLTVDESVQNYVATHIVVDSEGLWIIPDSGGNKVLIATGNGSSYSTAGTYIIGKVNNVDTVFAKFSQDEITLGKDNDYRLEMASNMITLYSKTVMNGYSYLRLQSNGTNFGYYDGTENYLYNVITGNGINSNVYSRLPVIEQDILQYFQNARLENGKLIISKDKGTHPASGQSRYVETATLGDGFIEIQSADDLGNLNGTKLWFASSNLDGDGFVIEALSGLPLFEVVQGFDSDDNAYALVDFGLNDNYSVDSDLRQAVVDKGWDNDVLNTDRLDVKALLEKLTASGGGKQQVWYGTSSTSASTATKVVTTTTRDFEFTAGNVLFVKFAYGNTTSSNLSVNVDGTTKYLFVGQTRNGVYRWSANETLALVYDGSYFFAVNQGIASTDYYGETKLNDSVTSTSTNTSATPNAVKQAYDLASSANDYEELTVTKVGSYYTSGTIIAVKRGGTVTIHVNALAVKKLTARTTVASIPAQYAPKKESYGIMTASSSIKYFIVSTDGEIRFNTGDAGTFYSTLTYVYGD